jgi:hypothetical protein
MGLCVQHANDNACNVLPVRDFVKRFAHKSLDVDCSEHDVRLVVVSNFFKSSKQIFCFFVSGGRRRQGVACVRVFVRRQGCFKR